MKRLKTHWLRAMGVALPLLLLRSLAFGQTKEIQITVDHPRPMEAAVRQLEELSGIPINYEGTPFYYSGDLQDVTDQARTTPPPGVHLFAPRGGQLSFSIAVDETTGKLNDLSAVKDALATVISAYNSSGLPGSFDFEEYNGVFFVKPVSYRDEKGSTQPMKPLLSTPISLPEEKRSGETTIRLILQQLSKAAGLLVGGSLNLSVSMEMTFGANNEPADRAIARFIAAFMCVNSGAPACAPANKTSETAWDIGFSYSLGYAPGWGYMFGVGRVNNSRWCVPPTPKPLPRPAPRSNPDGSSPTGRRITR